MLPFLQKAQNDLGGVVEIETGEDEGASSDTDFSDIAFKAVAEHMILALKVGDSESLAKALSSLCELARA